MASVRLQLMSFCLEKSEGKEYFNIKQRFSANLVGLKSTMKE